MTDNEKSQMRAAAIRVLKLYGHSPEKALEIAIDAERGDPHAKEWVNKAFDYDFTRIRDEIDRRRAYLEDYGTY